MEKSQCLRQFDQRVKIETWGENIDLSVDQNCVSTLTSNDYIAGNGSF